MFEMARPSLPSSPPRRFPTGPAQWEPGPRAPGRLGRRARCTRFLGLRDKIASRRQPRPPRGRRTGAARRLDTLTCLKLFINSPGGVRLRLWLRLRPRLLRPGGLAPPCGAHAKQINMPWLTHASQPADRVSAAPCGN